MKVGKKKQEWQIQFLGYIPHVYQCFTVKTKKKMVSTCFIKIFPVTSTRNAQWLPPRHGWRCSAATRVIGIPLVPPWHWTPRQNLFQLMNDDRFRGSKFWLILLEYAELTKGLLRGSKCWLTIQWFNGPLGSIFRTSRGPERIAKAPW